MSIGDDNIVTKCLITWEFWYLLIDDTLDLWSCTQQNSQSRGQLFRVHTNLTGFSERFLYYEKDFETCKHLKLRNFGNNEIKLEKFRTKLCKFLEFLVVFGNKPIKMTIYGSNWLVFSKNWVFFGKNWLVFWQNLGVFWTGNWYFCNEVCVLDKSWLFFNKNRVNILTSRKQGFMKAILPVCFWIWTRNEVLRYLLLGEFLAC